jgi:hypothetical protein
MRAMFCVFALMIASSPVSAQAPDKKELPKPLPEAVVKAWEEAGAKVGWMKINEYGHDTFINEAVAGAVPAFKFQKWNNGMIATLPVPETSFGLDLKDVPVTDAGLKELANFKNLTMLNLWRTKVTDAGLKELAPFKNLIILRLNGTQVTNEGFKELAKLKSLITLSIIDTQVTDVGLKELALQAIDGHCLEDIARNRSVAHASLCPNRKRRTAHDPRASHFAFLECRQYHERRREGTGSLQKSDSSLAEPLSGDERRNEGRGEIQKIDHAPLV